MLAALSTVDGQQAKPERTITLTVTENDARVIIAALGELAGKQAFYTTKKVLEQFDAQMLTPEAH